MQVSIELERRVSQENGYVKCFRNNFACDGGSGSHDVYEKAPSCALNPAPGSERKMVEAAGIEFTRGIA